MTQIEAEKKIDPRMLQGTILIQRLLQESNLHLELRRFLFYPLN